VISAPLSFLRERGEARTTQERGRQSSEFEIFRRERYAITAWSHSSVSQRMGLTEILCVPRHAPHVPPAFAGEVASKSLISLLQQEAGLSAKGSSCSFTQARPTARVREN
jgi:hypothetical protein